MTHPRRRTVERGAFRRLIALLTESVDDISKCLEAMAESESFHDSGPRAWAQIRAEADANGVGEGGTVSVLDIQASVAHQLREGSPRMHEVQRKR